MDVISRKFGQVTLILLSMVWLSACSSNSGEQFSTLELRSIQTKEYQSANSKDVHRAAVDALLDLGFNITSSDSDVGLLVATQSKTKKNLKDAAVTYLFWQFSLAFGNFNVDDVITVNMNVSISPLGDGSRIRLNAVASRQNSRGEVVKTTHITEPEFYQDFFNHMDKSLFIEENIN